MAIVQHMYGQWAIANIIIIMINVKLTKVANSDMKFRCCPSPIEANF